MDLLDNSSKGDTGGRVGALLLEDLQIQGKNKAPQCQFPELDPSIIFKDDDLHFVDHAH